MPKPLLLVPGTLKGDVPEALKKTHDIRTYPHDTCLASEETLQAEILVTFGHPDTKALHAMIGKMPKLRLIQALFAGVDNILSAPLRPGTVVCRGGGLHEDNTAELTTGLMISGVRGLHLRRDAQRDARWDGSVYRKQINPGDELCSLKGANILILGMGAIGKEIAKRLKPYKAKIIGVCRSERKVAGIEIKTADQLDKLLPWADMVVNVLPGGKDTEGMVNSAFFEQMKRRAWFINVGRGSSVNEADLFEVLSKGRIAGAAIDVAGIEPLPPASPLWKIPEKIIITPHMAGGGPFLHQEGWKLIAVNTRRFLNTRKLEHQVTLHPV